MNRSIPTPTLIYCGGGNYNFYKIAIETGFKYGVQLPDQVHGELYFADQNWKVPDRKKYMLGLAKHKPHMATVLDLEFKQQFNEVIEWAEEASQYVDVIQIIPKVNSIIKKIPQHINGKQIILGYSIPTKFGKTDVPVKEFKNWEIHLLGGTPHKQFEVWKEMKKICFIKSIDGNYYRLKATKFCEYWKSPGKWVADGYQNKVNAHYECFKKSCLNIYEFWNFDSSKF